VRPRPACVRRWGGWWVTGDTGGAQHLGNIPVMPADKGKSKISPPLAAPLNYFEATFTAMAGVPYHLWIRMRAQANSLSNDSVSVQFNDAVDAFGSAHYRIGDASGAEVVQQDGTSGSISGWGWADNGFGNFGPDIYFATTGTHTIRVQQRTDGAIVRVMSPTYGGARETSDRLVAYVSPKVLGPGGLPAFRTPDVDSIADAEAWRLLSATPIDDDVRLEYEPEDS